MSEKESQITKTVQHYNQKLSFSGRHKNVCHFHDFYAVKMSTKKN